MMVVSLASPSQHESQMSPSSSPTKFLEGSEEGLEVFVPASPTSTLDVRLVWTFEKIKDLHPTEKLSIVNEGSNKKEVIDSISFRNIHIQRLNETKIIECDDDTLQFSSDEAEVDDGLLGLKFISDDLAIDLEETYEDEGEECPRTSW